jgi:hypothetical protein
MLLNYSIIHAVACSVLIFHFLFHELLKQGYKSVCLSVCSIWRGFLVWKTMKSEAPTNNIKKSSLYVIENTQRLQYKDQSVNAV